MPSLMASIGLDATQFNGQAAKVIAKSKEMGQKVAAASSSGMRADMSRGAGLLSDPAAFINAENREQQLAARRRQTMAAHEVWLAKKNAATAAAAAKEKAIYGDIDRHMAKRSNRDALNREMGFVPMAAGAEKLAGSTAKAAQSTSALGGAAKMFAGYLTVDFIGRQAGKLIEYGGKIDDLSKRMGISRESVQQWSYALKQNGGDIQDAVGFFERLATARRDALEGNEGKMASFTKLGVSREMLQSGRLEDIGSQVSKAFQGGADPQQFLAELRDVGGRGAGEMVAMFAQGFDVLALEAQNLGTVISSETIQALDAIGDRMGILKGQFQGMFAPVISWITQRLMDGLSGVLATAVGFKGYLGTLFEAVKNDPTELMNPLGLGAKALKAGLEAADDFRQNQIDALAKSGAETAPEKFQMRDKETAADRKAAADERRALKEDAAAEVAGIKAEDAITKAAAQKHSVNSLQQAGTFLGNFAAAAGPEVAALNATVRSEQHLADIKKLLAKKGGSVASDVEY
jgi:hypothetical protein